jgi:ubiquinone/menaquinone biosynthesis C-methylase UbiE
MKSSEQQIADAKVARSQQYFNKLSLFFYDALLYGLISKYAWGSSTARLDAHYARYVSANHLEVGVGTGYLLDRVRFPQTPRLALMDLSPQCLAATARKVARHTPTSYVQNILEPITQQIAPFDSISVNYVMHCVPGDFTKKGTAFVHLATLLKEHGTLFGTTVLSLDVPKNMLARPFMWLMNALGVFNNRADSARDLEASLRTHFQVLQFDIVGVTAFFAVQTR